LRLISNKSDSSQIFLYLPNGSKIFIIDFLARKCKVYTVNFALKNASVVSNGNLLLTASDNRLFYLYLKNYLFLLIFSIIFSLFLLSNDGKLSKIDQEFENLLEFDPKMIAPELSFTTKGIQMVSGDKNHVSKSRIVFENSPDHFGALSLGEFPDFNVVNLIFI